MPSQNEIAMCKRKTRYNSDAAAQAALKRINPNRGLNKPRRAYRCTVCSGYHLSSKKA